MATKVWRGGAGAVAQLDTVTVDGTWATGDTATLTCNGKTATFTVGSTTTIAAVVAGLVAAWNDSDYPEMKEVTAADSSPTLTLTGDTAGVPFVVTVSKVSDSGTIATVTTTAATGPNHWNNTLNWEGGALPVSSDDVILGTGSSDVLYATDQSAVTLASLVQRANSGMVGLPHWNANSYPEYRGEYLRISATACQLDATGVSRVKIDFGTNQTACVVLNTGGSLDLNTPAVLLKGVHASNTLRVDNGTVGLAFQAGELSTFLTVTCNGGTLSCGPDLTLTTGTVTGSGTLEIYGSATTINAGAAVRILGTSAETIATVVRQPNGSIEYLGATVVTDWSFSPPCTIST